MGMGAMECAQMVNRGLWRVVLGAIAGRAADAMSPVLAPLGFGFWGGDDAEAHWLRPPDVLRRS